VSTLQADNDTSAATVVSLFPCCRRCGICTSLIQSPWPCGHLLFCSYIILREKIPLALKWNSIEAMDSRFFSEASDCWSYGVMTWEILTYGEFPYQGIPMEDVQSMVRAGLRLVQPQNCPDEVRICSVCNRLPAATKSPCERVSPARQAIVTTLNCCTAFFV